MCKKVSVIIPTYNRTKSVVEAIESVLNQTYYNIEIIVINDNGKKNVDITFRLEKLLKNYIEEKKIKYIKLDKNMGGAEARNIGAKIAEGEYLCFLDDDDTYMKNKIERQIVCFTKSKNKRVVFIGCNSIDENGYITNKEKYYTGNQYKNHLLNQHAIVGTSTLMFKKDTFNEVGGFEKVKIRQEYMLILKLLEKGYVGEYISENLVATKDIGEGVTKSKNDAKAEEMKKIFRKRFNLMKKLKLNSKEIKKSKNELYVDLISWYYNYNKSEAKKYYKKLNFRYLKFENILKILLLVYFDKNFYRIKVILKEVIGRIQR